MSLLREAQKREEQEKRRADFATDLAKMAEGQPAPAPQKWRVPPERFGSVGTMVGDIKVAKIPTGVRFADLLEGDAWRLICRHLEPGLFVICWADDQSWVGLVAVIFAAHTRGLVEVRQLAYLDLAPSKAREEISGFQVRFAGLQNQWEVVRLTDGRVMKSGIKREDDARREAGLLEGTLIGKGT